MQGITENWFSTNPFLPLINNSAPIVQERAISSTPTTRSPPGFQKVSGISSVLHNVASTPFDLICLTIAPTTRALLRAFANPDGDKFEEINRLCIGNDGPIDFVNKMKSILGNDRSHPLAMRLMRIKFLNCLPCEVESALRKTGSGLCFYHKRFGRNAIRCAQPCAWQQKRHSSHTPCELPTRQRTRYADSYARNTNRRVNSHFFVFDSRNNINFLVDTNSAVSVIPPLNNKTSLFHANPPISALTDTNIKAYGCQHMSVSLAGCGTFQWKFHIANVRHPILGLDFLDHFSVSIDIANRRMFRVPRFPRRVFQNRHKQPRIPKHLPRTQMSTLLNSSPSASNQTNLAETRVNATTAQFTRAARKSSSPVDVRYDVNFALNNTTDTLVSHKSEVSRDKSVESQTVLGDEPSQTKPPPSQPRANNIMSSKIENFWQTVRRSNDRRFYEMLAI
ncbi:uncharacterized protein LOC113475282 [Ciona intestinalis]